MNSYLRTTLALFIVAVLCSAGPAFAQDSAAPDADKLARQVVEATGDPSALEELAFTFVVERDGAEVASRRHVWRPKAGTLDVTAGEESYELRGLHDHDLSKLAKEPSKHAETWKKIAPNTSPEQAAKAWSWFINDSYWLLVPAKLFDPGVNRSLDEKGRLVLTFGEVGLTPGDRYMLTVDEKTDQVTRWDFELEGGRKGGFEWTDYEQVGPLLLSTKRVADEGNFVIRFEGVQAKPSTKP